MVKKLDEEIYDNEIPVIKNTLYLKFLKRCFDILFSGIAIVIVSPIYLLIILLELKFHGRPIMYASKRPGKDEKIFSIYKFRSMTNETDENGELLPEEERLTKFGRFIRKTSIDELPELFNIFKGDMSIIGPRPLLVEYLPLYSKRHRCRHKVKPGLACLRIVNMESGTWTWRDQFENDIWYIEHISLWTDVRMIFAIIKKIFAKDEKREIGNRVQFNGHNLDEE